MRLLRDLYQLASVPYVFRRDLAVARPNPKRPQDASATSLDSQHDKTEWDHFSEVRLDLRPHVPPLLQVGEDRHVPKELLEVQDRRFLAAFEPPDQASQGVARPVRQA